MSIKVNCLFNLSIELFILGVNFGRRDRLGFFEYVVNFDPKWRVVEFLDLGESRTVSSKNDVEGRPSSKDGHGRSVFHVRVHACLDKSLEAIPKVVFVAVVFSHCFSTNWCLFSPQPEKGKLKTPVELARHTVDG